MGISWRLNVVKPWSWSARRTAILIWSLLAVLRGCGSSGEDLELKPPTCLIVSKLRSEMKSREIERDRLDGRIQGGPQVIYVDVSTGECRCNLLLWLLSDCLPFIEKLGVCNHNTFILTKKQSLMCFQQPRRLTISDCMRLLETVMGPVLTRLPFFWNLFQYLYLQCIYL